MFNFRNFPKPIALTALIVSGMQFSLAESFAGQKTDSINTNRTNVSTNAVTATNGNRATSSVDCSIQSHPDCQKRGTGTYENYSVIVLKK